MHGRQASLADQWNWQIRWLEQFTATKEASCGFVCVVLQGQWKYSTVNFNYVIIYNLKMATFQLQFFGLLWGMHPDSSASKPRCWHQDSSASSRFNHHRVGEHNGSKSRSQKSLAVCCVCRENLQVQSNVVCGLPLQPKSDKAMACFGWNLFSHHLRKQTIQKELLFDMDPETYMIETHATWFDMKHSLWILYVLHYMFHT